MVRASFLLSAVVLSAVAPASMHASNAQKAKDLLFRSMDKNISLAISGIVMQRMSPTSPDLFQLKIEQAKDGRMKLTVLQPLSYQGFTTIDDGKEWMSYQPDRNVLVLQASPRLKTPDAKSRMKLAEKNYEFKLEAGVNVAGRPTNAVVAMPKAADMLPTRRYYFDKSNSFLLRIEYEQKLTGRRLLFDTKQISYLKTDLADEVFDEEQFDSPRRMRLEAPVSFTAPDSVRRRVGFRPVLPKDIPFGFVIQDSQVVGSSDKTWIAIRLSDGLATATVYQYDVRNAELAKSLSRSVGPGPSRSAKGVGLKMSGEVPEAAIAKILDAFVKEALKGLQTYLETTAAQDLLEESTEQGASKPLEYEFRIPAPKPGQAVYVVIGQKS